MLGIWQKNFSAPLVAEDVFWVEESPAGPKVCLTVYIRDRFLLAGMVGEAWGEELHKVPGDLCLLKKCLFASSTHSFTFL